MGRRKGRKETSEKTLVSIAEEEGDDEGGDGSGKFFAVYLLTSLSPRFKGHTYIGFTVNPRRRIRQHNGEIGSGAWRTKKRRPWEMVFCIFGFPTNVAALQFEWAWQHPVESLAVRKAAVTFKSLSGLANKIKLAYTMLTLPSWQSLNLTVNYFSTKYMKLAAGCPSLPEQMRVQFGSMDELPCYMGSTLCMGENDEWDLADDYCEQSGGSQESTEDGSADFQKLNNLTVVQDSFKEIEHCGQDNCTKESVHEQEGLTESTVLRSPKNLQIREEQVHKQSFQLNDSPIRKPSFSVLCSDKITRNSEDNRMFSLLDEVNVEYHELSKDQSPEKKAASKDDRPLSISSEVEVIDVFTPSPFYKGANNKKRRLAIGSPEIIDLTNSPVFV